jgi:hypothetical protein
MSDPGPAPECHFCLHSFRAADLIIFQSQGLEGLPLGLCTSCRLLHTVGECLRQSDLSPGEELVLHHQLEEICLFLQDNIAAANRAASSSAASRG